MATKGAEVTNLIERIKRYVDAGEYCHEPENFREARRLLNTELPQAVDAYAAEERQKAALEAGWPVRQKEVFYES